MYRKLLSLYTVTCMIYIVSARITPEERSAQQYLDVVQRDYVREYEVAKELLWNPNKEMTTEELMDALDTLAQSQNYSINVSNNLKQYNIDYFDNKVLQRHVKILRDIRTLSLDFMDFAQLSSSLISMKNLTSAKIVCSFEDRNTCNLAWLPTIVGKFKNSENAGELEYYWKAWRDEVAEEMRGYVGVYLELYKKSSEQNGYIRPSAQWYAKYDNPNFLDEMTAVMQQLAPIYKELHGYIRRVIIQKYPDAQIQEHGAISQHLLEQTIVQAWMKHSILRDPYPSKNLPNMKQQLENQEFTALKIVEVADEFLQSLGLTELPASFWSKYVKEIPSSEASADCKSEVFDFFTDVALKYCPKPYYKKFLQMHGDMTRVHYIHQKTGLPYGLREEACPGFGNALGEAIILSASSPKHIHRINLLSGYYYDEEISLNRLFRLGVHTLLQIPSYYIHEKIWADLLDGKLSLDMANCRYWEYMGEYMGVQPPVERSNTDFDFGYRFYEGLDERRPHSNKIISEILGYQFYKGLCEASGQYVSGNPFRPLQNCDFYGSHEAGNALKEIMVYGARRPWHDIIAPITGDTKLDGTAILEFFNPLFLWLKEENRRNKVHTGWAHPRRCSKH